MIIDTLNEKIVAAMKEKDEVRLSTFKLLSNEIHNFQIDHPEMSEEEELNIVRKEAKKRKDAIEAYKRANLAEKAKAEEGELKILEKFLPAQISDEELSKFVDEAISEVGAIDIKQMGQIIKKVMAKAQGNADGSKVASIVKEKLT